MLWRRHQYTKFRSVHMFLLLSSYLSKYLHALSVHLDPNPSAHSHLLMALHWKRKNGIHDVAMASFNHCIRDNFHWAYVTFELGVCSNHISNYKTTPVQGKKLISRLVSRFTFVVGAFEILYWYLIFAIVVFVKYLMLHCSCNRV